MKNYNGWTNRSTWLVVVWLDNHEPNYRLFQNLVKGKGINPSKKLGNLNPVELKEKLRTSFYYGDEINWDEVDIEQIKEMYIPDFIEEEEV